MSDKPIYETIKSTLRTRMANGELPEGASLPSENELAREHGVSRNQARQVLRELELEGRIVRTQGRRSTVAAHKRQNAFSVFDSRTVAIALPEYCSLYVRTILNALIARLSAEGFQSVAFNIRFEGEDDLEFLKHILASEAAGLATWVQRQNEDVCGMIREFVRASFPIVLVDRYLPGVETDFVVADNELLGNAFAKALIGRGHARIGYVSGNRPVTSSEDRFTGYRRALEEAGLEFDERLGIVLSPGDPAHPAGVNQVMAFKDRPTAFVCSHDAVAKAFVEQITRLGYGIPEDVELATLDDEQYPESQGMPMVTLPQNPHDLGDQAAEVLLARIRNPRKKPDQRFVRTLMDG